MCWLPELLALPFRIWERNTKTGKQKFGNLGPELFSKPFTGEDLAGGYSPVRLPYDSQKGVGACRSLVTGVWKLPASKILTCRCLHPPRLYIQVPGLPWLRRRRYRRPRYPTARHGGRRRASLAARNLTPTHAPRLQTARRRFCFFYLEP